MIIFELFFDIAMATHLAMSSCTGAQGNDHCLFFVKECLVSCCVLLGLLYQLLCTSKQGQNQTFDVMDMYI